MTENVEPKTNADLALVGTDNRGLVLTNLNDMQMASQIILQSGLCPDGYKTKEQVFVGLQAGAEIGLKPMQALNSIAVIRGKPTLWGDAALGLVKKSGLLSEFSEEVTGDGDGMIACVKSVRKDGEVLSTVETTFSVADAKTAGLWGKAGPWTTHPKRMLKYKARAFNLRDNFPDVLMGLHLTEEMEGEEPLPAPECDTPPRKERRKKIESTTVTEDNSSPPLEQPVAPDTEEVKEDSKDEGAAGTAFDTAEYDKVFKKFDLLGGNNFVEFAADVLCMDEEEVDSPEKFTVEMLEQLKRHLETEGA